MRPEPIPIWQTGTLRNDLESTIGLQRANGADHLVKRHANHVSDCFLPKVRDNDACAVTFWATRKSIRMLEQQTPNLLNCICFANTVLLRKRDDLRSKDRHLLEPENEHGFGRWIGADCQKQYPKKRTADASSLSHPEQTNSEISGHPPWSETIQPFAVAAPPTASCSTIRM